MDWSDGSYERMAATLTEASSVVVERAGAARGARVLDVGCGTGNAALAAARLGAEVTGVDPAARLLEVARARAVEEGLSSRFLLGDAGALPVDDASFDAAVSVFAVIFAPDAARVADELVRVVRPGGVIALATWVAQGGIAEAGALLRQTLGSLGPPPAPDVPEPPRWGDPAFVTELFEPRGASVSLERKTLRFSAPSAEAWFDEQGEHHPAWRAARRGLEAAGRGAEWAGLRERSVACLRASSVDAASLALDSPWLLVRAVRR
ncbi:MAG: methyltransferase domain-containing protein [Polyangiaceae bacterium]|nr:methyltransferase domain-containing protein [Polyangiaceae bacterium]